MQREEERERVCESLPTAGGLFIMWSSSGEDQHNSNKGLSRGSSLSSSSTSSSPSPFSSVPDHPRATTKTMEEVWKDINLSSLHDPPSRDDPSMTRFEGMILQDFLARPFFDHKESPPHHHRHQVTPAASARYGSPTPPPPLPPPPATMLTLNSVTDFHFLGNSDVLKKNPILHPHQHISNAAGCSPINVSFDAFDTCSPPIVNANGKKRCPEPPSINNSSDRRHKRMIKNRESAARSRARKQESFFFINLSSFIYTNFFR